MSKYNFCRGTKTPAPTLSYRMWRNYYEERVPEKIDNLESIAEKRPTLAHDLGEFDKDIRGEGLLPYEEVWIKKEPVMYVSWNGETIEFNRGGLAPKTRGGPLSYHYRRVWYYYTTRDEYYHYAIKKIIFRGRRMIRYYPEHAYRYEYMSEAGPRIPVAPGRAGRYWKPAELEPGQIKTLAHLPGGWVTKNKSKDKDQDQGQKSVEVQINNLVINEKEI